MSTPADRCSKCRRCPMSCGEIIVPGQHWREATCPCGRGYNDKDRNFVPGTLVAQKKAPTREQYWRAELAKRGVATDQTHDNNPTSTSGRGWMKDDTSGRKYRLIRKQEGGKIYKQWDHSDGETTPYNQNPGTNIESKRGGGTARAPADKHDVEAGLVGRTQRSLTLDSGSANIGSSGQHGTYATAPTARRQTFSSNPQSAAKARVETSRQAQPSGRSGKAVADSESDEAESDESRGRKRSDALKFAFVPEQEGLDGKVLEAFVKRRLGERSTCQLGEYKGRRGYLVKSENALTSDHVIAIREATKAKGAGGSSASDRRSANPGSYGSQPSRRTPVNPSTSGKQPAYRTGGSTREEAARGTVLVGSGDKLYYREHARGNRKSKESDSDEPESPPPSYSQAVGRRTARTGRRNARPAKDTSSEDSSSNDEDAKPPRTGQTVRFEERRQARGDRRTRTDRREPRTEREETRSDRRDSRNEASQTYRERYHKVSTDSDDDSEEDHSTHYNRSRGYRR